MRYSVVPLPMKASIKMEIPMPDHDGFVSWVKNSYTDNRWSDVGATENPKTGGSVYVHSGTYPNYKRFIDDVRPKLHEYGFVVSTTTKDKFDYSDSRKTVHTISAIPMVWVAAYANGNVCQRGACRHITTDGYCDDCAPFFDHCEPSEEPCMINS